MRRVRAIACVAAGLALGIWAPAQATPGELDPSFSSEGVTEIQLGSLEPSEGRPFSTALAPLGFDPSGDVVLAGSTTYGKCSHIGCNYVPIPTIVRLRPDGSPDQTFAGDGVYEGEVGPRLPSLFAQPSMQPDGKLLFGGESANPTVTRMNQDGSIDASFGEGGTADFPIPNARVARTVATTTRPDGTILVAVQSEEDPGQYVHDLTVVALNPDGSVDDSFGTAGMTQVRVGYLYAAVGAVAIDYQGRIIVSVGAATVSPGNVDGHVLFYRFSSSGSLDTTYGDGGRADYQAGSAFPSPDPPMGLDSGGRVYSLIPGSDRSILRLTEAGQPDATFGVAGVDRLGDVPAAATGPLSSLTVTPSDQLLIGIQAPGRLLIGRRQADGSPDLSFGSSGWAEAPTLVASADAAAALEGPDGRVVAAAGSLDHACAAVARFTGDPDQDVEPGPVDGTPCVTICRTSEGCPLVHRTLTIAIRGRGEERRAVGVLTAAPAGCLQPVAVSKAIPGRDRGLGADRKLVKVGDSRYRYAFDLSRGVRGKIYARVRPDFDPDAGTCSAARSPTVRVQGSPQRP